MKTKEFDLLVKYLKAHEDYKVTNKQLETVSKFKNWNNVTLQDIDRMKNIMEEYNLDKKQSVDIYGIDKDIKERLNTNKTTINNTEKQMANEGLDIERLGWHRRLHSQREYKKRQIENDLEHGIEK